MRVEDEVGVHGSLGNVTMEKSENWPGKKWLLLFGKLVGLYAWYLYWLVFVFIGLCSYSRSLLLFPSVLLLVWVVVQMILESIKRRTM